MNSLFDIERWKTFRSEHERQFVIAQYVGVFVLGLLIAWMFFGPPAQSNPGDGEEVAGSSLWTCAMHPQIRRNGPGDCPICGMELVPVTKTAGGLRTLVVSPEARALMNVQTAPVAREYVEHQIRMVGKVDYDETKLGHITAWVPGRLDRMFVDFTGVDVKKGYHMVSIYSEQLYSAQEELIKALKYARERGDSPTTTPRIDLVEASREKLRLLGLSDDQIKEIEQREEPTDHVTINAPVDGIVIKKHKDQGDRVRVGERIYTIADLSKVWIHLDAYETDEPWIKYGQRVTIKAEALPGETFNGRIDFVQPVLNDPTRTVKVRVNVPNEDGRLKPGMFVHGVVLAKVAAGGRVMDPEMAGKWISPMHPEIVKDEPGDCDVCGMPLVRAETLGFVAADTDTMARPLVIPRSSALVTGTRAVVYVELPTIQSGVDLAVQSIASAIEEGDTKKIQESFAHLSESLDRPYDQPGTSFAKKLWNGYADRLGELSLAGERVREVKQAEKVFELLDKTMNVVREQFSPPAQPTFEGREIVLGPRAGDHYLVRHGLHEGELVVVQGNFKIDAEIQIQAKPSMMTPEGGGGGGHDHGGDSTKPMTDEHAGHEVSLPETFRKQIKKLEDVYEEVTKAVKKADLKKINDAFNTFGEALDEVDGSELTGHPRMLWKEFAMLLGNDVVEGSDVNEMAKADEVYLLLKGHMRRLREQLGVTHEEHMPMRIEVAAKFQAELAKLWKKYLPLQQALAKDNLEQSQAAIAELQTALSDLDDSSLDDEAAPVWKKENANLTKVLGQLSAAKDLTSVRAAFALLSDEMGVLIRTFGLGDAGSVYQLHCPMVFDGRGAIWFQDKSDKLNPYYGKTMLSCADRVEQILPLVEEEPKKHDEHKGHKHDE